MSEQSARDFAERLQTDETFRNSLASASGAEERRAIASEAGYDLTPEDGPAIKAALGSHELSDDDLERIAPALHDLYAGSVFGYCAVTPTG